MTYEDKQKLLGEGANEVTAELHDNLEKLKRLNSHFGKMSLAVCEFYNSLLKNIVPVEDGGYKKSTLGNSTFLKAEI